MDLEHYPDRRKREEYYHNLLAVYNSILETFKQELQGLLTAFENHFTIKYRVKSFDSYYHKILNRLKAKTATAMTPA